MHRGLLLALALPLCCAEVAQAGDVVDLFHPGGRAAIALGGDPFRSPLDAGGGLWPHASVLRSPALRVDAAASKPLAGSASGGAGSLSGSTTASRLIMPLALDGRAYVLAVELASPQWSGSWSAPSAALSLGGASNRGEIEAFVPELARGLSFEGRLPLATAGADAGAASSGAMLRYGRRGMVIQGGWDLQRRPERLRIDAYDQLFDASLNLRSEQFRLDGRVGSARGLVAEGSFSRTHNRSLNAVDGTPGYALAPAGDVGLGQASLSFGPVDKRVLARWTERNSDLGGRSYVDGILFGRLDYLRVGLQSWLFAAELGPSARTRGVMEVELAEATLNARGELELWPFTPALVSLLGPRRVGYASGAARWSRWHAGIECAPRSWLGLTAGVNAYDIRPQASLESWQPMFLVFGRTGDRTDALTIERAQLGAVSLGGRVAAGRAEFAFGVRQFVAARIVRHAAVGAGGAGGGATPSPASSAPSRAGRWPGGTLAEFTMTLWL